MKRYWPIILALDLIILCAILVAPPRLDGRLMPIWVNWFFYDHIDFYRLGFYAVLWLCATISLWCIVLFPPWTPRHSDPSHLSDPTDSRPHP